MTARSSAVWALAFLLSGAALAKEEAPGLAVGTAAPALDGQAWVTADGKAPDLQGKVHLIEFWFER